jgi:hypothetical protein
MQSDDPTCADNMRLDHSMRFQISERNLAMFTVSRLAKSSLLVLLTATLTTAAYAGGGHSGSKASSGATGPVHGSPVQSNARIVSGQGNQTVSKGPVAHGFGNHTAWSKVIHLPTAPAGANK